MEWLGYGLAKQWQLGISVHFSLTYIIAVHISSLCFLTSQIEFT